MDLLKLFDAQLDDPIIQSALKNCKVPARKKKATEETKDEDSKETEVDDAPKAINTANNTPQDDMLPPTSVREKKRIKDMVEKESFVHQAANHMMQAQIQRDHFVILKDSSAATAFLAIEEQMCTFCTDYMQNRLVPSLAGEQPGPNYYVTVLNGLVLGIVDFSTKRATMAAHMHMEMDGAKGGDNVASMIWVELK